MKVSVARRAAYWMLDRIDDVSGRRHSMVPPRALSFVGTGNSLQIGRNWMRHFEDFGNLTPKFHVLDVGCGVGRMAIPFAQFLSPEGRYEGFDIVSKGIDWCRAKITSKHSNFHFQVADVYNEFYNPGGRFKASEYRFPYEDQSFDFVFLTSVFTHMLPEDVNNYLNEVARVLKRNRRCLASLYVLNDQSRALMLKPESQHNFGHRMGVYSVEDPMQPEGAVAYEEPYVRKAVALSGMKLLEPIQFGTWCGRKGGLRTQDFIVVEKGDSSA
jgi:ubiquinone/menaquinone biosynthesis C-methylase UbiE